MGGRTGCRRRRPRRSRPEAPRRRRVPAGAGAAGTGIGSGQTLLDLALRGHAGLLGASRRTASIRACCSRARISGLPPPSRARARPGCDRPLRARASGRPSGPPARAAGPPIGGPGALSLGRDHEPGRRGAGGRRRSASARRGQSRRSVRVWRSAWRFFSICLRGPARGQLRSATSGGGGWPDPRRGRRSRSNGLRREGAAGSTRGARTKTAPKPGRR